MTVHEENRESRDMTENSNFFYFVKKESKILFKSSHGYSEFKFLGNLEKLKILPDRTRGPNNGGWNICKIEQFRYAYAGRRKPPLILFLQNFLSIRFFFYIS